ncbi:MAG: hypothetical protein HYZ45_02965 [Burkholderiales bacterium]|nr:hypothetical protein [Burkholderiales bacterium]
MDSLNALAIPSRTISPGIHLRLIRTSDLSALSRFEIDNRAWFERHIASRGNYFYLPEGIRGHITHCLEAMCIATTICCVSK